MGKSSKRELEVTVPSSDAAIDAMAVDEPKIKKSKKSKTTVEGEAEAVEDSVDAKKEVLKEAISAIAKPLAGKKVAKTVLKLVKKG